MNLTLGGRAVFVHTGGVELDQRVHPAPPRRYVVLLHGAAMDHSVFRFQTRWLAHRGFTALAPDLPGHGRSAGEPSASIEEYAGWTLSLLDALGVDRAILIGHSMGSFVALAVAGKAPVRVDKLVLIGAADRMLVHPALAEAAAHDDHLAFELMTSWFFGITGQLGGHSQPGTWQPGGSRQLLERSRPGVLAVDLKACASYDPLGPSRRPDLTGREPGALHRPPVLLVTGEADRMTPPEAARHLADGLGGVLRLIPGAGHIAMFEKPALVNSELTEFLG